MVFNWRGDVKNKSFTAYIVPYLSCKPRPLSRCLPSPKPIAYIYISKQLPLILTLQTPFQYLIYSAPFCFQEGRCAYVITVVAILWVTEALPIAVTALIPIFLLPMLGVQKGQDVSKNYVNVSGHKPPNYHHHRSFWGANHHHQRSFIGANKMVLHQNSLKSSRASDSLSQFPMYVTLFNSEWVMLCTCKFMVKITWDFKVV